MSCFRHICDMTFPRQGCVDTNLWDVNGLLAHTLYKPQWLLNKQGSFYCRARELHRREEVEITHNHTSVISVMNSWQLPVSSWTQQREKWLAPFIKRLRVNKALLSCCATCQLTQWHRRWFTIISDTRNLGSWKRRGCQEINSDTCKVFLLLTWSFNSKYTFWYCACFSSLAISIYCYFYKVIITIYRLSI